MKAKYYIGIISVLLLTGSTVKAQIADMQDYRNDDARIVVNNYYDDYDYYFSSRINRFHRSYTAFNYYAPVFTETYWYNYQPYSWGISIYGGGGFGIGYSYNFPVYSYGYGYNNGWYDPYFGSSYYWGYDPFYYNNWYTPVVINVRIRNRWSNNYYGWYGHNHGYNDYRPVNNTYNNYNYPSTRYSSSSYSSRRRPDNVSEPSSGNISRREASTVNSSRTNVDRNRSTEKSNNGLPLGETRRNTNPTVNRGQGNNNSGNATKSANPSNVQVNRRVEQQAPAERRTSVSSGTGSNPSRTVSTPARSSSSSKSGTSASQGRSTSSKSESKASTSDSSSSKEKSTRRR